MSNIRGAREFLIGYGKSHPNQLSVQEREMMGRWYDVTPSDYDRIASSIKTTVKREAKTGDHESRRLRKAKRKLSSKQPAKRKLSSKQPAKRKLSSKAPIKKELKLTAAALKRRACASKRMPAFLKRYC